MSRPVLFLSDFGLVDEYAGVCHAVIARLAPGVPVIDLTHGVPPHDVMAGALALTTAIPYAPEDAVYLAVVDPGVGTERRGVAVEAGGASLVAPDNGVLGLALMALGGARRAVVLDPDRVAPWPVSETFHGRDVFAPAAARLATGAALEELGEEIDVGDLSELLVGEPLVEDGRISTTVIGEDRFGNLRLGAGSRELREAGLSEESHLALLDAGGPVPLRRVATFGDLDRDELGVLIDSAGWVAVVCNLASAAERVGLHRGDRAVIGSARTG
ncbi:MAG: SAM hydrolase/SAM-dependent halogenase family protein [Actinomycetota bacterium]